MRWSDVQHQPRATSVLRRSLRSGRSPHAYLFEGPQGVGKELAARALAARLLCDADGLAPDADACGVCRACGLVAGGNHPDFHLIHRELHRFHPDPAVRATKGLSLGVDVIRHFIILPASAAPTLGRRRVFLIRDAELMNDAAQNALLKTLEEPPGSACLILVTSAASLLRATIRSRCQRVAFDRLPRGFIEQRLLADGVAPEWARLLAGLSQGQLGAALQWERCGLRLALDDIVSGLDDGAAGDPQAFASTIVDAASRLAIRLRTAAGDAVRDESEDDVPAGPPRTPGHKPPRRAEPRSAERRTPESARTAAGDDESVDDDAPPATASTAELRDALRLTLMLLAGAYREALVRAGGAGGDLCWYPPSESQVGPLAAGLAADRLADGVDAVVEAERMIERNVQPQLALERLAISLAGEWPASLAQSPV